tara:strand:+ start:153128 stop:154141 length:1014 start_codon:yes stop_codon:yes gene_type:complete
MKCCSACFGDHQIHSAIFGKPELNNGTCSFCLTENVALESPLALRDNFFEPLISGYFEDDSGKSLVEWFKEDWGLFKNPIMDIPHSMRLLGEILDNGDIVRRKFLPIVDQTKPTSLQIWKELRDELRYKNRFFPTSNLDFYALEKLFGSLQLELEQETNWYRARIQSDEIVFNESEMGAPPHKLSSFGRANPAGIPYLYLASDKITAISEVRPYTGEKAAVATFNINKELSVIDLRDPRDTISPFMFLDNLLSIREDVLFLDQLGIELSQPVLPNYAAIDYTPTQFLCEFIKKSGYDGVMYKSSNGTGTNLALFNPDNGSASTIETLTISSVTVALS